MMILLISMKYVIYSVEQIIPTSFRSRVGDGGVAQPNLTIEYSSGPGRTTSSGCSPCEMGDRMGAWHIGM